LTYGALFFASSAQKEKWKKELKRLNRLAALCIAPAMRSTPTDGLSIIYNLPPIEFILEAEAIKTVRRIERVQKPKWDGLGGGAQLGHIKWAKNRMPYQTAGPIEDHIPKKFNWNKTYNINSSSFEMGQPIESNSGITIFTDGSKHDNHTGYGVIGMDKEGDILFKESGYTGDIASVFQTEVIAIQRACEIAKEFDTTEVFINSDSQAAIRALAKAKINSKTVLEAVDSLQTLGNHTEVTLSWVKAHVNFRGNELADKTAKEGAALKCAGPAPFLPINEAVFNSKVKANIYKNWTDKWKTQLDYRQTKLWFPVPSKSRSDVILKKDRQTVRGLVKIITGHNNMNYHRNIQKLTDDSTCRRCEEAEETAWHVVWECPELQDIRQATLRQGNNQHNRPTSSTDCQWSINRLVSFMGHIPDLMSPEA